MALNSNYVLMISKFLSPALTTQLTSRLIYSSAKLISLILLSNTGLSIVTLEH